MKQVGVQTNIKAGVTGSVGAYTPTPPTPPAPPSNPSAIVSGAGTAAANGTYTYTGTHNAKPQYNSSGTDPMVNSIVWDDLGDGTAWYINTDGLGIYDTAGEDVAFPWLSATWHSLNGDDPVPTVTQG